MNGARQKHTASLLKNGKVLVIGGYSNMFLNSTELYDPSAETWTTTGDMNEGREMQTVSLLKNEKCLLWVERVRVMKL
jgi:hypothetical protein